MKRYCVVVDRIHSLSASLNFAPYRDQENALKGVADRPYLPVKTAARRSTKERIPSSAS